jgi:phosphoribosylformylglycinamidine synthase
MKGRVLVFPRPGTPDPEGEGLAKTIGEGGFDGVSSVRQGRVFEIDVSTTDPAVARARITEIANEHLADSDREQVEVLVPGAGPEAYGVVAVYDRRRGERRSGERRSRDRRSGEDRRLNGMSETEVDENRRTGSDRRSESDRRTNVDRREESDRRSGLDRRSGEERRGGDEKDFEGAERRSWIRRGADR